MATGSGAPIGNLLFFAAIVLAPTALCWGVLKLPTVIRWVRRRRTPPPVPDHPPIQTLAADLRRLHRTLADFEPGTPMARRLGTRQAYDAVLAEACDAVEVEQRLAELPEGIEREMERLRLAESLRSAGLSIS
jgi:hypothetical protein